jgi:hypothetical protein
MDHATLEALKRFPQATFIVRESPGAEAVGRE